MKDLTKREYFAAMAMQALIPIYGLNFVADKAVEMADALIEELEERRIGYENTTCNTNQKSI